VVVDAVYRRRAASGLLSYLCRADLADQSGGVKSILKLAGTSEEVGMVLSGESLLNGFNAKCGLSTAIGLRKMPQCARFDAKTEAARVPRTLPPHNGLNLEKNQ
jgi:hypothetical protein